MNNTTSNTPAWLGWPLWALLAVPMLSYTWVSVHYPLNIPFADDYSSLITQIVLAIEAQTPGEWMAAMFLPSASHTPFLTRLILLVQGLYFGGINFKYSLIAANLGMVLAAAALTVYCLRKHRLPLYAVLPIPFLLLSITHWEQMDFLTPAWQMSWGSMLLPILCIIAATENRPATAGVLFAGAVYFSAGGYILVPLVGAYYLFVQRNWKSCLQFGLVAGLLSLPLWYFTLFQSVNDNPLDIKKMLYYFATFMGNIISTGSYDLRPYIVLHRCIGAAMLALFFYACYKHKGYAVEKMLFLYVIGLGLVAAYVRGPQVDWIPPRYSSFSMLALTAVYIIFASELMRKKDSLKKTVPLAAALLSIFLWAHSYASCIKLLDINQRDRTAAIEKILSGDLSAMNVILFNPAYAINELERMKRHHLYDMEVMRE